MISTWKFDSINGKKFKSKYILHGLWVGKLLIMYHLRLGFLPYKISIGWNDYKRK